MTEMNKPSILLEQRLRKYYETMPREDFFPTLKKELRANNTKFNPTRKAAAQFPLFSRSKVGGLVGLLAMLLVLFLLTPGGKAFAQQILQYFTRASSDTLPLQAWQLSTPTLSGKATVDAANMLNANLTLGEVEKQAGYDVLEPAWLPENLSFAGASFEDDHHIVRIFYRYVELNGLVIREEPFTKTEDCELCGELGASASVETVQIEDSVGEYVEGVWKLTDNGPVWESDPYLKSLRWQKNGLAIELQYMGPPASLTKEELIKVAKNLR